jgi:para-aminobenzoate synthetase component 1
MTAAGLAELPLAVELRPVPDVESAFVRLAARPHSLFLDSALRDPRLGRYSFLAADPFDFFTVPADRTDGLSLLEAGLRSWPAATRPGLPPFQGGAAGLLSYDLGRSLERIPTPRVDEFKIPTMAIGLYDTVLAFDHAEHRTWLISQGFPETNPASRLRRATRRVEQFQEWLQAAAPSSKKTGDEVRPVAVSELVPQFIVAGPPGLTSNFSADGYRAAVQRAIDYIYAGDVFQVNLAQRLLFPAADDAISLYLRLRQGNPAPFSGWFDLRDAQIVSASPERFLSVCNGRVEGHRCGDRPACRGGQSEVRFPNTKP